MGKNKGKPIFGLGKIPERELLKMSRIEVGQLKSYIDELEYMNKKLTDQLASIRALSRQERKALRERVYKDALWNELKIKNETLQTENARLKKRLESTFSEVVRLRLLNGGGNPTTPSDKVI